MPVVQRGGLLDEPLGKCDRSATRRIKLVYVMRLLNAWRVLGVGSHELGKLLVEDHHEVHSEAKVGRSKESTTSRALHLSLELLKLFIPARTASDHGEFRF